MNDVSVKKVMHIVEAPGGVERYLVSLLTELKKQSEYQHILVCSGRIDVTKFKGLVFKVIVIKSMVNSISFFDDIKSVFTIRKVIKLVNPDILYCHSSKAGALGRFADIGIKNRVLYNAHGWAFNMKGESRAKLCLYKWIERVLAFKTDSIICISKYEKKSAISNRISNGNKMRVINNGIIISKHNKEMINRDVVGVPDNAFVIGTVGRLSKQKAPEMFVKMANEVQKNIQNAFFIMVGDDIGDGSYKKRIEQMISEYNLDKSILITGWVDNPESYIQIFDVAVLLSRWEGFGLVLPEYMLNKKPIIATNVDAIPGVIGDAGVLVDVDDYEMAAEKVISVWKDDAFRNELIEKDKQRVHLFDIALTAKKHIILFDKLMNVKNGF